MTTSAVTGSNFWNSLVANSSTTPSSVGSSATGTTGSTTGSSQDLANTFLTLLVAQMNNQDPLNPVDNTQLTSQMAQISTVTGINNLNSSVNSLLAELQQSSAIQSAQLTGHGVMVSGSALNLATNASSGNASGESSVGAFSLGAAAQNVSVTISDSSGNVVRTMNLGAQNAGIQDFQWDGTTNSGTTAPAGSYTFAVSAASSTGASVSASTYNLMTVVGTVPQSNGSTELLLSNGATVPYTSVAQII